jgi:hypothetical protein
LLLARATPQKSNDTEFFAVRGTIGVLTVVEKSFFAYTKRLGFAGETRHKSHPLSERLVVLWACALLLRYAAAG